MILVKHLFDEPAPEDGERIWIEPIGLTRDLIEWCQIAHVMTNLAPSKETAAWFQEHPAGFDFFEAEYLEELCSSPSIISMRGLAAASTTKSFTLVHHGDHPVENSATVLATFLLDLAARARLSG
jgi:uncharacterized protein YeaO (DUF488 family)